MKELTKKQKGVEMMFDFDEIEDRDKKAMQQRIEELDNQVRHWQSMYNKEVKNRRVVVKYMSDKKEIERIRSILKLHHDTRSKKMKELIIQELYLDYGIIKEPTNMLMEWWSKQ